MLVIKCQNNNEKEDSNQYSFSQHSVGQLKIFVSKSELSRAATQFL